MDHATCPRTRRDGTPLSQGTRVRMARLYSGFVQLEFIAGPLVQLGILTWNRYCSFRDLTRLNVEAFGLVNGAGQETRTLPSQS
jgi:hypothetical protein